MRKIFIDPGHGGVDPGAVGNGIQEKEITLQIGKQIAAILEDEYENVKVKLSRSADETVTLKQRTDMANDWGATFYLAIHVNSGGGTGYEDYIFNGNVRNETVTIQNTMHEQIIKEINLQNRGKKRANFYVLRMSRMPALLTENGFIDHVEDASKLKSSTFIKQIARGHVNGLEKAFNLRKKSNVSPPANDEPSDWAKTSWEKANKKIGKDDNPIMDGTRPKEYATREEIAKILDRLGVLD